MPDFTLLTAGERRELSDYWNPRKGYRPQYQSLRRAAGKLGVTVDEATRLWHEHPQRGNQLVWDIVDTLRTEAMKRSP